MIRKLAAVTLAISFIAMATSGLMMFFIEKPSFTIRMHPVHKTFGLLMVIAAITHITLNYRLLLNHLKSRSTSIFAGVLVVLLVLAYGVVINNEVPSELAGQMDAAAAKAEGH